MRRFVDTKVLPGEPLDGTGKVRIHLFVADSSGAVVEPHGLHPGGGKGELVAGPSRGRVACDRRIADVQPRVVGATTYLFHRTDDPRAVTCPECKASQDYATMMELLAQAAAAR